MATEPQRRPDPITPPEHEKLHKFLLVLAVFLFLYLVLEAAVLMPYILLKYGWQ